jgi:hypothetical protein
MFYFLGAEFNWAVCFRSCSFLWSMSHLSLSSKFQSCVQMWYFN